MGEGNKKSVCQDNAVQLQYQRALSLLRSNDVTTARRRRSEQERLHLDALTAAPSKSDRLLGAISSALSSSSSHLDSSLVYTLHFLSNSTDLTPQPQQDEHQEVPDDEVALRKKREKKLQVRAYLEQQAKEKKLSPILVFNEELKNSINVPRPEFKNFIVEALDTPGDSFTIRICCECDRKFPDSHSHIAHLQEAHFSVHSSSEIDVPMPERLDSRRADEIAGSSSWKPIDLKATLKVLDKTPKRIAERTRLLGRACESLRFLMDRQCLSECHVNTVVSYSRSCLKLHDSQLLEHGVRSDSVQCICFLGASHLQQITEFLGSLRDAYLSTGGADDDDPSLEELDESEAGEGRPFVFRTKACVVLNAKMLSSISGHEGANIVDSVVEWLYDERVVLNGAVTWMRRRIERRNQSIMILMSIHNEFKLLLGDCNKKMKALDELSSFGAAEALVMLKTQPVHEAPTTTIALTPNTAAIVLLNEIDVKIMKHLARIEQLKLKLDRASTLDYLPLVLPPLQRLLREKIEARAEGFAEGNSKTISAAHFSENCDLKTSDSNKG